MVLGGKCFFIGHRDAPFEIYDVLCDVIEQHISEFGVTEFYVGNHGSFDFMAGKAVGVCKKKYANISLYLCLAYYPKKKLELPAYFDGSYFPEGQEMVPYRVAIPRLNRYVIAHSDFVIAYVKNITGGAYVSLEYAEKLKIRDEVMKYVEVLA